MVSSLGILSNFSAITVTFRHAIFTCSLQCIGHATVVLSLEHRAQFCIPAVVVDYRGTTVQDNDCQTMDIMIAVKGWNIVYVRICIESYCVALSVS